MSLSPAVDIVDRNRERPKALKVELQEAYELISTATQLVARGETEEALPTLYHLRLKLDRLVSETQEPGS